MRRSTAFKHEFEYQRKTWSPRASYHLAYFRHGDEWAQRLASACWLIINRIPLDGVWK